MGLLLRKCFNTLTLSKRNLFNENFLGITAYRTRRENVLATNKGRKLKTLLQEVVKNPERDVLSHQIKQMCYVAELPEDSEIIAKALEKYCTTMHKRSVVFQNFNTGPELMRMLYVLNLPLEGMMMLKNPITSIFFNDVKSFIIIQDLLYNNELYNEVCELFSIIKEKQIGGWRIPLISYILFQAACYKMNTSESYNNLIKVFQEYLNFTNRPIWPVMMYTMIFALENEAAEITLKHPVGHDDVSANIRLAALIKTGNVSEAVNCFNELHKKSAVLKSVASDLCSNLEKLHKSNAHNTDILDLKDKINNNYFTDKTFEELAAEKIYSLQKLDFS